MLKVLVTQRVPAPAIAWLRERVELDDNDSERPLPAGEFHLRARGKDALVTFLTDRIDAALLDAAPSVKVVANVAVGFDNIDLEAAQARKVIITNTPGVLTETTADLAFALLMAAARRLNEAERFVRSGKFEGWGMMMLLGSDIYGKALGLAGLGRIGQAVARRGRGFAMRVLYTDEHRASRPVEEDCGAEFVDKATLLRESDFLSLHVPLMPSTRHYIGAAELAQMKRDAYLINTARGPVVDEAALARALREGTIAGAGLDVFEHEPVVHPDLLACENAVMTPHIASASVATRTRMAMMAAENVVAFANGEEPPNRVV